MRKLLILLALPLLFTGCATQSTKMSAADQKGTYRQASDESRMNYERDRSSMYAYDVVPQ